MAKRTRTRTTQVSGSKAAAGASQSPSDQTKTDRAYQSIKRAIVKGELAEGTFLSESDVIQKYGVGRTPFREACNRLIHEGLLEVVPRRGYLVPELSFHGVRDLFELRVLLESSIIELATIRANEDEMEHLSRLAAEVPKRGKSANGFEIIIAANNRFHLELAKATRNQELQRLLESILERTERVMYVELRFTKFDENAFKMIHGPIIEAMRKRDVEGARDALMRDIAQAQDATFGRLLHAPSSALTLKRATHLR